MDLSALKKYRPQLIILLLFFFMAGAFILRILPALVTRDQGFFPIYDTDTYYNLRQIEVMVHHFPQYNWFDPMTAYPQGKQIDWGPLYPFLAAVLCLITGASTQGSIVSTAGFVSPLLAVLMVPVMYGIGKQLGNYKTGLVAAGLISVSSMMYFTISSYGMADHHVAEVFFSSLFFLIYLYALAYARQNPVDIRNRSSLPQFCLIAALAGIIYFLGLITSTTIILTLMVIAIYTLVQVMADLYKRKNSDYLCVLNLALLGTATVLFILFGFKREVLSFSTYSIGIVYVHLAVMAGSAALWLLARYFQEKRGWFFVSLAVLGGGALVLVRVVHSLQNLTEEAMELLFGSMAYTVGVQETLPWSFVNALEMLNVGIILAAAGFLVLGYTLWKRHERERIFFFVWSLLMLILTVQHQRFLYYFTVNIVLLSAFAITEPLRWKSNPALRYLPGIFSSAADNVTENIPEVIPPVPKKTGKKRKPDPAPGKTNAAITRIAGFCFIILCLLAILHIALSLWQDYQYGISAKDREIPGDWIDSLEWLNRNTPDPGIDYFGQYTWQSYSRPAGSYGIMAVWDAGHWITFFAHRPPITNPFQDNLGGAKGTAAFFLSENESKAVGILAAYGGRYVFTDSTMAIDRFTNLVPWATGTVDISPYIKWFLLPAAEDRPYLKRVHRYDNGYFQTLVVRLHNFDGAMTEPATAEYTTYAIRLPTAHESADAAGYSRVITGEKTMAVSDLDTTTPIIPEGAELRPATYAALYSSLPDKPLQAVPALRQFRLIHESEHNATATLFPESDPVSLPGIRVVKIFESVKGARMSGTGIIELPLVTNTGRAFTYRQESHDGEFVLPYSTLGNPYEVQATGPYHIAGTSRFINVTEQEVIGGMEINTGR
jgi:dolichyl-diphosphooligosaccharide--protein glycosyltransferase